MNCVKVTIALLAILPVALPTMAVEPIQLRYCYENRELLPHFSGNSAQVPLAKPGALIDILRQLDNKVSGVEIRYQRAPWQRCLNDLRMGKVDALVGSYTRQREAFAVYPKTNGTIDHLSAVTINRVCLLHQKSVDIGWDGVVFNAEKSFVVSITRGYRMAKVLKRFGFKIYETDSEDMAHELLLKNRVEASIGSCNLSNIPQSIILNPRPISTHYGYLFISKPFHLKHRLLVQSLWQALTNIDKEHYYRNYQPRF